MPDNVIKTDIQDYWRRSYVGDKEIPSSNLVETRDIEWHPGYYISTGDTPIGSTPPTPDSISLQGFQYGIINCEEGFVIDYNSKPYYNGRSVAFLDENNKLLWVDSVNTSGRRTFKVKAPANTKKVIVHGNSEVSGSISCTKVSSRLYAGDKEVDIMYAGDEVAYAKHKDNLVTALGAISSGASTNTTNHCTLLKGHSDIPYQVFTASRTAGEKYTFSFDVTDCNATNLVSFMISNEPSSRIEYKGVGHYSKTFTSDRTYTNCVLGLYRDYEMHAWEETDKYCIIKNFKLERNLVDTEYSLAPSVTNNRVKIGKHWYNTCTIGSQEWLSENLNEDLGGGTWEGYFNNDPNYGVKGLGKLYTWDCICSANETPSAAMAALLKDGWRVPTKADFDTLVTRVGASNPSKIKEKWYQTTPGTNETGFSSVIGGYRNADGTFTVTSGVYNSATNGINADSCYRFSDSDMSVNGSGPKLTARSIRLVRDVPVTLSAPPTTGSAYVASVNGNVGWVSED